jgi:hypothetical protein
LHQIDQGRIHPLLNPFANKEMPMETINSLGLRYQGEVIGWIITHRPNPETIRYSNLYVDPRFYFKGFAISLLIKSMQLHQLTPDVPHALFEVNLTETEPSWWNFVKRRLIPYATKTERFKWAFHVFLPPKDQYG